MSMETSKNTHDRLLAEIEISRTNLYVFRDSKEKDRWEYLLDKAEKSLKDHPEYSIKLTERVNEVIDNLWKRIFRWKDFQKRVIGSFAILILVELILISFYYHYVSIVQHGLYSSMLFGLLGGSLGVVLNLGKDLKIEESNQLAIAKLSLRPLIGVISAMALYCLLQLKIITILPELSENYALIVLSMLAGYSERFVTKIMSDYAPKVFGN